MRYDASDLVISGGGLRGAGDVSVEAPGVEGAYLRACAGTGPQIAAWLKQRCRSSAWVGDRSAMALRLQADAIAKEIGSGVFLSEMRVPTEARGWGLGSSMIRAAASAVERAGGAWAFARLDHEPGADDRLARLLYRVGFNVVPSWDERLLRADLPLTTRRAGRPARERPDLSRIAPVQVERVVRGNGIGVRVGRKAASGWQHLGGISIAASSIGRCEDKLRRLARRVGIDPSAPVMVVDFTELDESLRGSGLGSWLYAEAARLAWAEHGAVLVPSACKGHVTSKLAKRAWAGDELARQLDVEDAEVAVWRRREGDGPSTPPPAPAGLRMTGLHDPPRRTNPPTRDKFFVYREVTPDAIELRLLRPGDLPDEAPVAHLTASLGAPHGCGSIIAALEERVGEDLRARHGAVFEVLYAGVDSGLRGRGLGAWLYAEAARLAWEEAGCAIVSNACGGGSTSPDAAGVWAGAQLARHADVEASPRAIRGAAAVWRRRSRAGAATPPPSPDGLELLPFDRPWSGRLPNPPRSEPTLRQRCKALSEYLAIEADAWDFAYLLPDFFAHEGDDAPEGFDRDDPSAFLQTPEGVRIEPAFVQWLKDVGLSRARATEDAYSPAYLHFDGPGRVLPKDTWLVHFSDRASHIARRGFVYGHAEHTTLGLTTWFSEAVRQRESGWNFAFRAESSHAMNAASARAYGSHAVLFQSSGLEVHHWGDREDQVIFWGPSVKRLAYMHRDGVEWVVEDHEGEVVADGSYRNVTEWVMNATPARRRKVMRTV